MKIEWLITPTVGYVPSSKGECTIVGRFGMRSAVETTCGRKTTRTYTESAWGNSQAKPFGQNMEMMREEFSLENTSVKIAIECESRGGLTPDVDYLTCARIRVFNDKTTPVIGVFQALARETIHVEENGQVGLYDDRYAPVTIHQGAKIEVLVQPIEGLTGMDGKLFGGAFNPLGLDEFFNM